MKHLLLLLFLGFPILASAQMMHHQMTPMAPASTMEYQHVHHHMHQAMDIEFSGDPDIDFLRGMIPHHQGAVDMAMIELAHGRSGNVREFAHKVIRDQKREIRIMESLLKNLEYHRRGKIRPNDIATAQSKRVNHHMHQAMMIDYVDQPDIDFMVGMIPHHQGAIDMARIVLAHGTDRRVKQLAQAIISAQTAEIYGMKLWLKRVRR